MQDLEMTVATVLSAAPLRFEPNYEPGMLLEITRTEFHYPKNQIIRQRAAIEKIVYNSNFEGSGNPWFVYLQGERSPTQQYSGDTQLVGVAATPAIRAGETYAITIPADPTFTQKLRALWHREAQPKQTMTIDARVLTQASLAQDSLVYLTSLRGVGVYAVRASALEQREFSKCITLPEITVTEGADINEQHAARMQEARGYAAQLRERGVPEAGILPTPQRVAQRTAAQAPRVQSTTVSCPEDISRELGATVLHQLAATRAMAVALYDHAVRKPGIKKSNILIVGDTGTGKTELAQTGANILDCPFAETKLSAVSSTGYKGANLVDIFNDIVPQRSHRNFDRSVILIDEIDKAANTTVGTSSGFGPTLQNELIAWTESAKVQIGSDRQQQLLIDTKDMLFIGAGAFVGIAEIVAKRLGRKRTLGFVNNTAAPDTEELLDRLSPEDLENYGLKPELIARFPVLTYTKQLPPDAIISIMKTGRKSSFLQQIALLRDGYNTDITFDEEVYHILADAVAHQKRGARGIETVTQKLFAEIKHDMRSAKNRTALHITPADALGRLANLLPAGYKR